MVKQRKGDGLRVYKSQKHPINFKINGRNKYKVCSIYKCDNVAIYTDKPKHPKTYSLRACKRCHTHKLSPDKFKLVNDKIQTLCNRLSCDEYATYSDDKTPKRCKNHKTESDTYMFEYGKCIKIICQIKFCDNKATYSNDRTPLRCRKHKLLSDFLSNAKRCEEMGCNRQPKYGSEDGKSVRCGFHRLISDYNVTAKRCSSEACKTISNIYKRGFAQGIYKDENLCSTCYKALYIRDNKLNVNKEIFVLSEIQRQLPEFEKYQLEWSCSIQGQTCSDDKPDMVWKIGDTLLHVEVDENGLKHEDNDERIVSIHSASGCKFHICIRFNPDRSTYRPDPCFLIRKKNGATWYKKNIDEWNYRIPILIQHLKESFRSCIEDGDNVKSGKIKLFF